MKYWKMMTVLIIYTFPQESLFFNFAMNTDLEHTFNTKQGGLPINLCDNTTGEPFMKSSQSK